MKKVFFAPVAIVAITFLISGCGVQSMDTFKGHRYNIQKNPKYGFSHGDTVQSKRYPEMVYIINQPMVSHSGGLVGLFYSAKRLNGGMSYWLPERSYKKI